MALQVTSQLAVLLLFAAAVHGVQYLGCFRERSLRDRLFKGDIIVDPDINNTPQNCVNYCRRGGYSFAGVQYGGECHCDSVRPPFTLLANSEAECNRTCTGDSSQFCGAWMRMNVYSLVEPAAITNNYQGCYAPSALRYPQQVPSALTRESCKDACEDMDFKYYGMASGSRCVCGSELHAPRRSEDECRTPCNGNDYQLCGGYDQQLSVFRTDVPEYDVFDERPTTTRRPTTTERATTTTERATTTTERATTTRRPAPSTYRPVVVSKKKGSSSSSSSSSSSEEKKNKKKKDKKTKSNKPGIAYGTAIDEGCYEDAKSQKLAVYEESSRNSLDLCYDVCSRRNFKYAGLSGRQCLCGSSKPSKKSKNCNTGCPGRSSENCGGRNAINVYKIRN